MCDTASGDILLCSGKFLFLFIFVVYIIPCIIKFLLMVNTKIILFFLNSIGYGLWGFSILSFIDEVLTNSFTFANAQSFLGLMSMTVAIAFAIAKLYFYIKDAVLKIEILREELSEKKAKNKKDFYTSFNEEFNKQKK